MARYKAIINPPHDNDPNSRWTIEVQDSLTGSQQRAEIDNPYDEKASITLAKKLARKLYNESRKPIKFEFDI